MIGDHVAHAPALVRDHGLHRRAEMRLALVVGEGFGDGDEGFDGEEADGILVVLRELAEGGEQVGEEGVVVQSLGEGAQLLCGGATDHGGIVGAEGGEHFTHLVLSRLSCFGVGGGEEGGGRGARGEPFAGGETLEEGEVVLLDLLLVEGGADLGDGFCSLVAYQRLLHRGEDLQDGEEEMSVLWSPYIIDKALTQLLGQGEQDFVVVVQGFQEERDELCTSALGAQSERDGRDAVDGVEAEGDVL
jgi:hypothetical protein